MADDKELNQWYSFKKMMKYRYVLVHLWFIFSCISKFCDDLLLVFCYEHAVTLVYMAGFFILLVSHGYNRCF